MAVVKVTQILCLLLLILLVQLCSAQYEIPEVTIQVFKPKGFQASIPDAQNISIFVFQGNINRAISNNDVGTISGEVTAASNGRWGFQDPNVQLNIGDVINYYVFIAISGAGYLRDKLSYRVTKLDDSSNSKDQILFPTTESKPPLLPNRINGDSQNESSISPPTPRECRPTVTKTLVGTPCAGQTIFEEDFSSIKEDVWQIEHYIPTTRTDYPFVSYQRHMVSVSDGNLRIRAGLQQDEPQYTAESITFASLNLKVGCTSTIDSCSVIANGPDILRPVVAGHVVSRQFAFAYGTVFVRAKLPQGDWLYPDILLEPLHKIYGTKDLASGHLKIACARGNKELYSGYTDYGNKILYGGPMIDSYCPDALLANKPSNDGRYWGDDFHIYSLRWAPERITLSVDGQEWARIEPSASGLRSRLPNFCRKATTFKDNQSISNIAPFDQFFRLSFGVNAGGVSDFKDGIYTEGNRPKPWSNQGRKAALNFFNELYAWHPTWSQPELLIDYVKVVAL